MVSTSNIQVSFLFSERSDSFLIWQFYSFHDFLFPLHLISIAHFYIYTSIPDFWLYILLVGILLSSRTSVPSIDVDFLNQNQCMPTWPGIFQFGTFSMLFWSISMCHCLRALLEFFFNVIYPFSLLWSSFCSHILLQNRFASFATGWVYFLDQSLRSCW